MREPREEIRNNEEMSSIELQSPSNFQRLLPLLLVIITTAAVLSAQEPFKLNSALQRSQAIKQKKKKADDEKKPVVSPEFVIGMIFTAM